MSVTNDCEVFGTNADPFAIQDVFVRPRRTSYLAVKFCAEWLLALFILVVTSPVALLLAFLVKITSPGMIFYSQTRLGRGGHIFKIYKFRSMEQNAEKGTGPVWAAKQDWRVTPLGRILRATHLDELPQLWNVLRGEMALIGPRPERPELAARIVRQIPDFHQRLAVRPGITGLAQMLLPADDPADADLGCVRRKLAHDLCYVRKVGFLMDFRIALGTPCYFLAAVVTVIQQKLVACYEEPDETDSGMGESWERQGEAVVATEAE